MRPRGHTGASKRTHGCVQEDTRVRPRGHTGASKRTHRDYGRTTSKESSSKWTPYSRDVPDMIIYRIPDNESTGYRTET